MNYDPFSMTASYEGRASVSANADTTSKLRTFVLSAFRHGAKSVTVLFRDSFGQKISEREYSSAADFTGEAVIQKAQS